SKRDWSSDVCSSDLLGLALVGAVGMLGASMKASVAEVTETAMKADFVATGPSNSGFPVPNGAVREVQDTPGVGTVGVLGSSLVKIGRASCRERGEAE